MAAKGGRRGRRAGARVWPGKKGAAEGASLHLLRRSVFVRSENKRRPLWLWGGEEAVISRTPGSSGTSFSSWWLPRLLL